MKILIRNTTLSGEPLDGDGQVFEGKTELDIVHAMNAASLIGVDLEQYLKMVTDNIRSFSGQDLEIKGVSLEEMAESFITELESAGFAEFVDDEKSGPITLPRVVLEGLDVVRRSGVTHMLDRPMVVELARKFGFPETAKWIEANRARYSEGLFRGFRVEGGKS